MLSIVERLDFIMLLILNELLSNSKDMINAFYLERLD